MFLAYRYTHTENYTCFQKKIDRVFSTALIRTSEIYAPSEFTCAGERKLCEKAWFGVIKNTQKVEQNAF